MGYLYIFWTDCILHQYYWSRSVKPSEPIVCPRIRLAIGPEILKRFHPSVATFLNRSHHSEPIAPSHWFYQPINGTESDSPVCHWSVSATASNRCFLAQPISDDCMPKPFNSAIGASNRLIVIGPPRLARSTNRRAQIHQQTQRTTRRMANYTYTRGRFFSFLLWLYTSISSLCFLFLLLGIWMFHLSFCLSSFITSTCVSLRQSKQQTQRTTRRDGSLAEGGCGVPRDNIIGDPMSWWSSG